MAYGNLKTDELIGLDFVSLGVNRLANGIGGDEVAARSDSKHG
jgi:hypothetical protein